MENKNPYAAPQVTGEPPNRYLAIGYPRRAMRFWRVEQLKAEMLAQPLSERESLPYLIVYVASFTLATGFPNLSFNWLDALGNLLSVVIAIAGTILIYHQNGGVNGRYFLQRYFAIGFVVGIRCLAGLIAGMFALIAVFDSLGMLSDETTLYEFIFMAVAEIFVYWRIAYHTGDLAASTNAV